MIKTFGCFVLLLAGVTSTSLGAVNSIVIGATSTGAYSGPFGSVLGNYVDSGLNATYGLGLVTVDEFATFGDVYEEYPDPLGIPILAKQASLYLSLDIGTDKELRFSASSTLEQVAIDPLSKNYHSASIGFSISKDSTVVSTLTASTDSTVSIFDSSNNLLWAAGDGVAPYSMVAGAYRIDYMVFAEVGRWSDSLDLLLAFTPQTPPPNPPGPTPPPGPEGAVPEPASIASWLLGISVLSAWKRSKRCISRSVIRKTKKY
ncbi:MAG: hypothetical protein ACKN85_03630 [Pirellula sp.]